MQEARSAEGDPRWGDFEKVASSYPSIFWQFDLFTVTSVVDCVVDSVLGSTSASASGYGISRNVNICSVPEVCTYQTIFTMN